MPGENKAPLYTFQDDDDKDEIWSGRKLFHLSALVNMLLPLLPSFFLAWSSSIAVASAMEKSYERGVGGSNKSYLIIFDERQISGKRG